MWRNWNPLNPPVNQVSSDEEHHYESADEINPDLLVSPNRPHQSPTASPGALLIPDSPPIDEVLAAAGQQLAAAMAANYDTLDTADGDKAADYARSVRVEFDPSDIKFWFAQLEDEMTVAAIGSQWLKKTVLQRNLPLKQKEDVKALLTLQKVEAGADIYLRIKNELIRIYAPKPQDSYRRALTRTMTGLPSQLGSQIVDDVCKKSVKLDGCCCAGAALALWTDKLPINIRAHISGMEFNKNTYKQVFEAADKVFLSSRQIQVSAVSLDETVSAFTQQNQPLGEVAAITSKNRNNRGQKKNKKNQNQGQENKNQGQKHDSVPDSLADKMCNRHYGDSAWYCLKPSSCPWKDKVKPRNSRD